MNKYIARLSASSPSKVVRGLAQGARKVGNFADNILGNSARTAKAQAETGMRMATSTPSKRNMDYSGRLLERAVLKGKQSKKTRLITGGVAVAGGAAYKAGQKDKNDVYYDSY